MKRFTLKTKVTLLFPMAMTLLFACLLLLMYSFLQKYIKETVSNQQYQIVSVLAEDIDRSFAHNSEMLASIAKKITPGMVDDPQKALLYLIQQREHLLDFNNGLFIFTPEGRVVAELPLGLERVGMDFSFREYFKQTIAIRKPFISDPYESALKHHHPAIMFTAPVFNNSGTLLGILGGSVDLSNSAFIGRLTSVKMGKSWPPFLFNSDRLIVFHPDNSRIMKHDIPPGANKLLDQALTGFDGSGETVNGHGLKTLSTYKHLKTKNWILGADYPLVEAYAAADKIRNVFLIILPIFSLGLFWFMRRYLNKMTDPIITLTRHVEELPAKSGAARMFQNRGGMRSPRWDRPSISSCMRVIFSGSSLKRISKSVNVPMSSCIARMNTCRRCMKPRWV